MDVQDILTWGPVPLTVAASMLATMLLKSALGRHAEHDWAKRLLPLVSPVVGALLGLIPGFLPTPPGTPPALVGGIIGGLGPMVYGLRSRPAARRRLARSQQRRAGKTRRDDETAPSPPGPAP